MIDAVAVEIFCTDSSLTKAPTVNRFKCQIQKKPKLYLTGEPLNAVH